MKKKSSNSRLETRLSRTSSQFSSNPEASVVHPASVSVKPQVEIPQGWWFSQDTSVTLQQESCSFSTSSKIRNEQKAPALTRTEQHIYYKQSTLLPESDIWNIRKGDFEARQYNAKLLHRRAARQRMEKYTLYLALLISAISIFLLSFLTAMIPA